MLYLRILFSSLTSSSLVLGPNDKTLSLTYHHSVSHELTAPGSPERLGLIYVSPRLSTVRPPDVWVDRKTSRDCRGRADTAQARGIRDHPVAQDIHEQCQPRDFRCHNTCGFDSLQTENCRGELSDLCGSHPNTEITPVLTAFCMRPDESGLHPAI